MTGLPIEHDLLSPEKVLSSRHPESCIYPVVTPVISKIAGIHNLHTLVDMIGAQSFFIYLDDFHSINLPQQNYALVIRILYPLGIHWTREDKYGKHERRKIVWMPIEYNSRNLTFTRKGNNLYECSFSKFYKDEVSDNIHDLCVRLDFYRYTASSKPWRCQGQFSLMSRFFLDHKMEISSVFQFLSKSNQTMKFVVSSRSYLNLLIINDEMSAPISEIENQLRRNHAGHQNGYTFRNYTFANI